MRISGTFVVRLCALLALQGWMCGVAVADGKTNIAAASGSAPYVLSRPTRVRLLKYPSKRKISVEITSQPRALTKPEPVVPVPVPSVLPMFNIPPSKPPQILPAEKGVLTKAKTFGPPQDVITGWQTAVTRKIAPVPSGEGLREAKLGSGSSAQSPDDGGMELHMGKVWRMHRSIAADSAEGWVVYQGKGRRIFADKSGKLIRNLGQRLKLAAFTAPDGTLVYVDVPKIKSVLDAWPGHHHKQAHAVLVTQWGNQEVTEKPDVVRRMMKMAMAAK